ncbi:MAG: UbiX family flavin prenyltransferase [Burkholderiales bacterium]|nr:UbiX family flavin prenyltransferase [Burkholderiales bacterium]
MAIDENSNVPPRRIVVGISGASGAQYGIRLLQALRESPGVETHAVVSPAGWRNLRHEMHMAPGVVDAIADQVHDIDDIGASIASGSFRVSAMVVAPCSMRTLAAIAHGLGDNLIARAADVMLKERRRLVLVARETPLSLVHLRNMVAVTEMGAIVCPPVPAFYLRPRTVEDIVSHTVGRVLDLLDIPHELTTPWSGESEE